MPYHISDDGSPSTRYRHYVKARLFRTHAGLSVRGIIGIVIAVIFAAIAMLGPHRMERAGDQAPGHAVIRSVGGETGERSR